MKLSGLPWIDALQACERAQRPCVLITVLGARGSTPRDSGSKMVVENGIVHGSIGGGELEHRAQRRARELLAGGDNAQCLENVPLGEKLGQCCGGSATLLFECFATARPALLLFGAGHVGRALAPLLATLPLRVTWVDTRVDAFPDPVPAGIHCQLADDPLDPVRAAAAATLYLVMTHQHPLDFAIVEAVLARGDAGFLGVIGSRSKWRRFRWRLEQRGYTAAQLDRVHCPVGLAAVPGKLPAEIAVSVAAQLIAHCHAVRAAPRVDIPGWKAVSRLVAESGAGSLLSDEQNV